MDIRKYIKKLLKDNGAQQITAEVMRSVLLAMVDTSEDSQYLIDATSEFGYIGGFPGALQALVAAVRTSAVFVSFLTSDGRREMWQFNGGEFADPTNWQQFTGGVEEIPQDELATLIDEILTSLN